MKRFLALLAFVSLPAFAQTPHITFPFNYVWDYPVANMNGSPSFTQVHHFEIQIDGAAPMILAPKVPIGVPSSVAGFLTFKFSADPLTLPIGAHSFNVRACSDATPAGCVASLPFAFALDPLPLPSASRLGVGA